MTQGKPFAPEEDAFIKANCNEKYPSVIARYLGTHYPDLNGGFRSTKAVAERMTYWVEQLNPMRTTDPTQPKKVFDARKLNGRRRKTSPPSSHPNSK